MMSRIEQLLLLCSFCALLNASPLSQSELKDWEDPGVFARNQRPGHNRTISFSEEASAQVVNPFDSPYVESLNGTWRFDWAKNLDEAPSRFFLPAFDVSSWDKTPVPSNWQMEGYGHPMFRNVAHTFLSDPPHVPDDYNPVGSYRTDFLVPETWRGRRTYLRFEGVKSASFVWLNGKTVGYDQGGMEPAEYDISDLIQPGTNVLAVRVLRFSDGTYLECQDMWRLSGIYRDVYIYSKPPIQISDYFVTTDLDSQYENAQLQLEITVSNFDSLMARDLTVGVQLLAEESSIPLRPSGRLKVPALEPGETKTLAASWQIPRPRFWSAEDPYLYRLLLKLEGAQGGVLEVIPGKVGFREVEIRNQAIIINGVPVKFNGVNRHEHDPVTGKALTLERMEQDLRLMKQFNINLVRTSHYPPDPKFLDLADEYGIYIVDEVNDEAHAHRTLSENSDWQGAYLDRMNGMVLRDRNHPSIILWSAGNESGKGKNLAELIRRGHLLDPSRPAWMYGATSTTADQPFEDIIGPRYPPLEILQKVAQIPPKQDPRPSFMDEYDAATGNSLGHFDEYWRLIRKYRRLTGGAIWDWVSPGIRTTLRTTSDRSGNGVDGAILGRANLTEGKSGKAICLSGHDEWVELYRDGSLDLGGGEFTLWFWVYPRGWNGTNSLLTKGDQFGVEQSSPTTLEFYVLADRRISVSAELPPDWDFNWHEIASTCDGKQLKLYIDRRLMASTTFEGRIEVRPWPLAVGKNVKTQGQNHRGPISNACFDEVRIYGTALDVATLSGETSAAHLLLWLGFEAIEEKESYFDLGIGARSYGLVWPDRSVQPELWQVKKTGQPVHVEALDLRTGHFRIENRAFFTNLNWLAGKWTLQAGGDLVGQGELTLDIPPQSSREIDLQIPGFDVHPGTEYWLTFEFTLKAPTRWAARGHEVAFDQFRLPLFEVSKPLSPSGSLKVHERVSEIEIVGDDFVYRLDRKEGFLVSMVYKSTEIISQGPVLNLWRAPTANELDEWRNPPIAEKWFELGLDRLHRKVVGVEVENGSPREITVTVRERIEGVNLQPAFLSSTRYSFTSNGEVKLSQSLQPEGDFPDWLPGIPVWLPRIGHQLKLPTDFEYLVWYGRGPFETYPDRKTGARIGIYASRVRDQYVPYLIPQEHGNRTDVRWVALLSSNGIGLWAGGRDLQFSARHFSEDNLTRALYPFQLEMEDEITLNLNHAVTGVGGTPVPTLARYRTIPRAISWSILLVPFDKSESSPSDVGRKHASHWIEE